jgi:hypothetical protein
MEHVAYREYPGDGFIRQPWLKSEGVTPKGLVEDYVASRLGASNLCFSAHLGSHRTGRITLHFPALQLVFFALAAVTPAVWTRFSRLLELLQMSTTTTCFSVFYPSYGTRHSHGFVSEFVWHDVPLDSLSAHSQSAEFQPNSCDRRDCQCGALCRRRLS